MKSDSLVVTIFASDRPGIVQHLSDVVLENNGNWTESRLSHLCGQFAGIVNIVVADKHRKPLLEALAALEQEGIFVTEQEVSQVTAGSVDGSRVQVSVEANDRPGIVEEISAALAAAEVNVQRMSTACASASMAGYSLFSANIRVALPEGFSVDELESVLESVSDDLMVSVDAES